MRKSIVIAAGLLVAGLVSGTSQAAMQTYKATINGASEVPPVTTSGTGAAAVNVDPATMELSWTVTYSGLTGPAAAAHIHCGAAAGANGPVAVSFGTKLASPIKGSGKMTAAQLADLEAGKCYVNIHTAAHKPGEIRGQLSK
ncbi:MAG TPA: CHRD domain-containing protein [Stellaceae bacterium]|nr:CHRD domain-containing protein [Stellaceae bacterium]